MITRRRESSATGFTILELMVSMGIFTILGSMVIVFMQQSLNIFSVGTQEAAMYDRMDSVLPEILRDLETLFIGDDFDAPAPPPTDEELANGAKKPPPRNPPPVQVRSGYIKIKRPKDFLCPYFAFIGANASEWTDKVLRRAGDSMSSEAKPVTPEFVESDKDHIYLPTGGLMEIVWIAIPDDPENPSILTLYRGTRGPIGHPKDSLLLPSNLDTIEKIKKACRPKAKGVLHFAAVWRRSFSDSFDTNLVVGGGETDGYVGAVWDSTRGLDTKFPLYRRDSAGDPSDDVFPAFVRLEIALIRDGPFGYGRGELQLNGALDAETRELKVSDPTLLQAPGGGDARFLKIGTEWMGYDVLSVEPQRRAVRVRRGERGTKKVIHPTGAWVFVGTQINAVMKLPFRDNLTVQR